MLISSWLQGQQEGSGQEQHPCRALGKTAGLFPGTSNVRDMFGGYRDPVLSAAITLGRDQPHSCFLDKLSLCGYVLQQYLVTAFRVRVDT